MMLIAGTLFAWAIWFRLLSNALFAALAAYLDVWASVVLGVLCVLGLYRPQQHADLYASLDQVGSMVLQSLEYHLYTAA
jgi:hypothetical protein